MPAIVRNLRERLSQWMAEDGTPARFVIAYSGGIDSTVLLHAMSRIDFGIPVLAVHIDHQLCAAPGTWDEHCQAFAASLSVDYISRLVNVDTTTGSGPEAAARSARYAAFETIIQPHDWLLSAHHQSDQGETLLLNLFRGSGLAGLSAIGHSRVFANGRLVRPFLSERKECIETYAREEKLSWIDDPSNAENRFDRNFLRNDIVPSLEQRWPALVERLARSAELAGEAQGLLDDLARIDLQAAGTTGPLDIKVLSQLSVARQKNLLRYAIRQRGYAAPPSKRLTQIVAELVSAREDAQPLVRWADVEVRRYRNSMYILRAPDPRHRASEQEALRANHAVDLGSGLGTLCLRQTNGDGIDPAIVAAGLEIRYRLGGESIRPLGHPHARKLKTLLQDEAVLPWMRDRIPLLFSEQRLVAVADLWISAEFCTGDGYRVFWENHAPIH